MPLVPANIFSHSEKTKEIMEGERLFKTTAQPHDGISFRNLNGLKISKVFPHESYDIPKASIHDLLILTRQ